MSRSAPYAISPPPNFPSAIIVSSLSLPRSRFTKTRQASASALYSAWTEQHRVVELRALLANIARHQRGFHLLAGDFNTLAPGDLLDFRKLPNRLRALVWLSGGKIRWRTIQLVLDAGYVDAYRLGHQGISGFTFPSWAPHVRLDYVFTPAGFSNRVHSCEIVTHPAAPAASDHLPLLAEVDFA